MKFHKPQFTLALLAVTTAALTACGGGSAGTGSNAPSALVVGVAATGLAIANGNVTLNCTTGNTAPVTTATDGSYSVDVSKQTLPCVARVDYKDASGISKRLHSLVKAAGIVNITPVTDMVVANLSASGIAADVTASDVQNYTADQISTATRLVKTYLESKGVSTAYLPQDVIGTKLEAAHGLTTGDAQDKVLDSIDTKLSSDGNSLTTSDLAKAETEIKSGSESGNLSTSSGQTGDASAGKASYQAMCQSCHGASISDGRNASKILKAIQENEGGMGKLSITQQIADNIATYLAYGTSTSTGSSSGTSTSTGTSAVLTTQTISLTSPGAQTLGTPSVALQATASSGLSVSFSSSTPAVCQVSANTASLLGLGNCTITASQAGNASYAAAPIQVVTFGVTDPSAPVTTPPVGMPTFLIPVASTGKALYAQCSSCHGAAAAGGSKVLNGANSALTIQTAIQNNLGGMGSLTHLSPQDLADIAAYLATPTI